MYMRRFLRKFEMIDKFLMIAPCGARGRKALVADGRFMVSRANFKRWRHYSARRLYGVLSHGTKKATVYSGFQEKQGR